MMISRLVISLKKVATEWQPHLRLEIPSAAPMSLQDEYSSCLVDGIPFTVIKGERI